MARIGVQAMMLKDEFEADGAFTTLKRLNELGFNVVEISQISMSEANVGEIQRARAELGMEIAALSAALETPVGTPGDSLMNDFDKIVADCRRLACLLVRMGMMPLWAMASKGLLSTSAEGATRCSRRSGKAISTFRRSSIKACPAGRNICSSSRTTSTAAIRLTASPLPVTTSSRSATALSSEGLTPTRRSRQLDLRSAAGSRVSDYGRLPESTGQPMSAAIQRTDRLADFVSLSLSRSLSRC
jgi:hypothetical protein